MTYAAVSAAHIAADLASGGTTSAVDTSGSDLLIWGGGWFSGTPVPSDAKSNTWNLIANYNSSGQGNLSIWYALAPSVGTGETYTSGTNRSAIVVGGFSGSDQASPLDVHNGAAATFATSIQPGNLTPSVVNCLVVTVLYYEVGTAPTISAGWTILDNQLPGNSAITMAYQVQTTATTVNPTWTCSQQQTRLAAEIVSFIPATGGGGGGLPFPIQEEPLHGNMREMSGGFQMSLAGLLLPKRRELALA